VQQYIGAAMLIIALFLVLFSNWMEERLTSGKAVLLVTCRLTTPTSLMQVSGNKSALLPGDKVVNVTLGVWFVGGREVWLVRSL